MSATFAKRCIGLIVWGLLLASTLSIADWPVDCGHSICGVWGCGPPLQALVSCHLAWMIALTPIAVAIRRFASERACRRISQGTLALAILSAMGFAVHELLWWYPLASEWQREFYWVRVSFVIITTVEAPVVEVIGLSVFVLVSTLIGHKVDQDRVVKQPDL